MSRIDTSILGEIELSDGHTLKEISDQHPVMLVFLRHFGCVFCREALRDIANKQDDILADGRKLVFVHMSNKELANKYFRKFNIVDPVHICDPDCQLYQHFGLLKGSFSQLFGLQTMMRGFQAGISLRQFGGAALGDAFQMPGIFMVYQGQIEDEFVHETVSDRPDYVKLAHCCGLPEED